MFIVVWDCWNEKRSKDIVICYWLKILLPYQIPFFPSYIADNDFKYTSTSWYGIKPSACQDWQEGHKIHAFSLHYDNCYQNLSKNFSFNLDSGSLTIVLISKTKLLFTLRLLKFQISKIEVNLWPLLWKSRLLFLNKT